MRDTWFLVAGGPSLKGFDFSSLKGRRVIAVNKAFQKIPDAEIVYFTDLRFWQWYSDEMIAHKGRLVTVYEKIKHQRLEHYKLTGKSGLDINPGCLKGGNNSGYAAINLAVHLGAKNIILLGYDMCFSSDGASHWHDPHPILNKEITLTEKMLGYFESLVAPLQRLDVFVINANPASAIKCFPKMHLHVAVKSFGPVKFK